jgi:hypothetical protein
VIHNKRKDFHARNFARVTEQLGNGVIRYHPRLRSCIRNDGLDSAPDRTDRLGLRRKDR